VLEQNTKEVKVLQADLNQFERALQALILSQFRHKVFEKYKKRIKPVILFKSKTIKESQDFFVKFTESIKKFKIDDLQKIENNVSISRQQQLSLGYKDTGMVLINAFNYFKQQNVTYENLISELKEDFSESKCISINSKEESEEKQIAINSLEDDDNEYRAVFAVDKLNEGWDVLNLFDIVRLYDTRDAKAGIPGRTTMSEAQLIGRGARYCPFQITIDQPKDMRKYDFELDNELRICEELYYHSAYNPQYIQELNTALVAVGIKAKQTQEIFLNLKKEFKSKPFYKAGLIFLNEQEKYNRQDIRSLSSTLVQQPYTVYLKTGRLKSSIAFVEKQTEDIYQERAQKELMLKDFGTSIIRTAINKSEFYKFTNLINYLPNLKSISEFITSNKYLGKIKILLIGLPKHIEEITQKDKLSATIKVLEDISAVILSEKLEFCGTREFKPNLLKEIIKEKPRNYTIDDTSDKEEGKSMSSSLNTQIPLNLSIREWYIFEDCFGTSQEKYFIKYFDSVFDKFKEKYDEIYLVRNERHFKIYNFEDGRPLEPDFVLFLIKNKPAISMYYQVFIEPKGEIYIKNDQWKENFLKKLKDDHRLEQLWRDKKYIVWGMPFYNEGTKKAEFVSEFEDSFLNTSTD